jgi:hypothetical protein
VFLASLKGFHAAQPTHLLIAASVLATVPIVVFLSAQLRAAALRERTDQPGRCVSEPRRPLR